MNNHKSVQRQTLPVPVGHRNPQPVKLLMHYTFAPGDWPDTWVAADLDLTSICSWVSPEEVRTYSIKAVLIDGEPQIQFERVVDKA